MSAQFSFQSETAYNKQMCVGLHAEGVGGGKEEKGKGLARSSKVCVHTCFFKFNSFPA